MSLHEHNEVERIRELIPRLESEGLIHTVPKRGMQIAQVDLALIRDAFQFRLFLEKEAAAAFSQAASAIELKRLRDQHDIGLDAPMLNRERLPCAPHAAHDFVGDQKNIVVAANFGDSRDVPIGRSGGS